MSDTLLQSTSFASLPNWSVQYLLQNKFSYNDRYNLAHIGDFLTRNKTAITLEDDQTYKRVTIKINNGGVRLRDTEKGINIGTKNQFVVSTGQFLLSKIDARNGAFGVVPQEVDNAIITGNFWTFDVDYAQINPHFLALMTTTPEFIIFCNNASNGTTNRHYLQEDLFLEQKIPLPTLDEQNRLIDNYNQKIAQADHQEKQALELEQGIEEYLFNMLGVEKSKPTKRTKNLALINFKNLSKWSLDSILKESIELENGTYPCVKFGKLALFFKGGRTPSKSRKDFWHGEINWTSPKDFKSDYLFESEDSLTVSALRETGIEELPIGTFLSVFRSGILRHSFPTMITKSKTTINQDLKAYQLDNSYVLNDYFLYFTQIFKEYILTRTSKKGVTVESINTEEFLALPIPLPPLSVQQEIANHISALKQQVKYLKEQAQQNRQDAITDFEKEIFKA